MNAYQKELTDQEMIDLIDDMCSEVTIGNLIYSPGYVLQQVDEIAFDGWRNDEMDNQPWVCAECEAEYDDEEEADSCCKREHLAQLLEEAGYSGIDASTEESLYEYGLLYNAKTNETVFYRDDEFFQTTIDIADIKSAIEELKDGFYSFMGMTKDEYLSSFNSNSLVLVQVVYDIDAYNGRFSQDIPASCNIDDMIKQFTNIKE